MAQLSRTTPECTNFGQTNTFYVKVRKSVHWSSGPR